MSPECVYTVTHNEKRYVAWLEMDLIEAGVPQNVIDAEKIKQVQAQRLSAYRAESDPLYMEWQFNQNAESELAWKNKVAEIKARFPLPAQE